MAEIRIVVWNVTWMNDLFTSDGPVAFKPDGTPVRGPRSDGTVASRRASLAGAFGELDADAVVVVEGPNRASELQLFFDTDVAGDWACDVQPVKGGSQIIGLAVRTDRGRFADPPFERFDARGLDGPTLLSAATDPFDLDTDDDELLERHRFERRPLYAELRLADGTRFRVLGLHLKSKGIFGAYEWSKWWSVAEANRKKLLAQCFRLRTEFLDRYLTDAETREIPLVVCGDVNDGPGFDASERRLLASGVERLMGSIWRPRLTLGNALFDALDADDRRSLNFSPLYTASFRDPIFARTYHRVWIDHLLYTRNQPHPWVRDAAVHVEMADGQRIYRKYPHASDHFPLSATIETRP